MSAGSTQSGATMEALFFNVSRPGICLNPSLIFSFCLLSRFLPVSSRASSEATRQASSPKVTTLTSHNAKPWKVCPSALRDQLSILTYRLDFRTQLSTTDYGNFLANEPSPVSTSTIAEKATQVLVDQFNFLRANAVEPLSKFFDYITYVPLDFFVTTLCRCWPVCSRYAYMIDNVVLLITGTLHERDTHELLERCHPLGVFDTLPALCVATNVEELYHTALVETPLGTFMRAIHQSSGSHPGLFSSILPRLSLRCRSRCPQH